MSKNGKPRSKIKSVDPSLLPELPDNWSWATLNDLAADEPNSITDGPFGSNLKTAHYTDAGPRVIRLQNVGDGEFVDGHAHISQDHFESLARHHAREGDIAIAALGETLPRSCVIPPWLGPALVKADCPRFRPNTSIVCSEYVNFALNSPSVRHRTSNIIHGVGRPRLNLSEIRGIWLAVAPLSEQRRIVSKIEELFSDLDAGVAALKRAKAKLKRYRFAVLKAAVEGKLTAEWRSQNPNVEPSSKLLERILKEHRRKWEEEQLRKYEDKGKSPPKNWKDKYKEPKSVDESDLPTLPEAWCWARVEQVAQFTRYGSSAKTSKDDTGIPVLRMGNIVEGDLDFNDLKYLPVDHSEFPDLVLSKGDLLFNRTNSAELVGKSAVYRGQIEPCSYASYLIAVRCFAGCDPHFLCHYINSTHGRRWIKTVVSQQVGQANVNGTKLQNLVIPFPSVVEQNQIVDACSEKLSQIDAAEKVIERSLTRAARLRQSILKRAFEGKLVPQDPNDEPASALIERIKQRDAVDGNHKPKKRVAKRSKRKPRQGGSS